MVMLFPLHSQIFPSPPIPGSPSPLRGEGLRVRGEWRPGDPSVYQKVRRILLNSIKNGGRILLGGRIRRNILLKLHIRQPISAVAVGVGGNN